MHAVNSKYSYKTGCIHIIEYKAMESTTRRILAADIMFNNITSYNIRPSPIKLDQKTQLREARSENGGEGQAEVSMKENSREPRPPGMGVITIKGPVWGGDISWQYCA